MKIAILIDADNISASLAGDIFKKACSLGEPIVRRAYGMVNCFSASGGWNEMQREYGILAKPQVSNVSKKNVADIALVIDAMELLYRGSCEGICIVSNDSDFTALAAKIREGGKMVFGIGGAKAPESFRVACTKFLQLGAVKRPAASAPPPKRQPVCPRCGGRLMLHHTKSRRNCWVCEACGGMSARVASLEKNFTAESLEALVEKAKLHREAGCVCPQCGGAMTLMRVAGDNDVTIEIDVCGACKTVWYDKNEFETLIPTDGVLDPAVSVGKAFRRETVLLVAADLRQRRVKAADVKGLRALLKNNYFLPAPDINPVIQALCCDRVVRIDKAGGLTVLGA